MRLKGVLNGEGGWFVRIVFRVFRHRFGAVPPPLRIYAYHPAIMRAFGRLTRTVRKPATLPPRLKGLAMYWTARTVQCAFCIDLTDRLAREAGITAEEIRELPDFLQSSRFSELEKAVLEYAEAMTKTPADVPEELFSRLFSRLGPKQMVELTAAIALENFSARFNRAFDIETADAGAQGKR